MRAQEINKWICLDSKIDNVPECHHNLYKMLVFMLNAWLQLNKCKVFNLIFKKINIKLKQGRVSHTNFLNLSFDR